MFAAIPRAFAALRACGALHALSVRRVSSERRARWESLCLRCGKCCYEKDGWGPNIVTNWRRPCIHLDTATHLCTIYEKRFSLCPQCRRMTLRHAISVRWLRRLRLRSPLPRWREKHRQTFSAAESPAGRRE